MLRRSEGSEPMSATSPKQSLRALGALRQDMQDADDQKIRQIVALIDTSPENQISQLVLDPLRPRLAALRPIRPLRLIRLLSIPFDELIVPAPVWKPGQSTVPRTVLKPLANIVRIGLGHEAVTIERMIAGHNTGDTEIVTRAGRALWGRAAEILGNAPRPTEWENTGLRPDTYSSLAKAVATVLQRASALRRLLREAEIGVLNPDEQAVRDVISNLANEPPEGCAMVFKLLLGQLPHAAPLLRRLVDSGWTPAEKAVLQTAMSRGTEEVLAVMEARSDLPEGLRAGPLAAVGSEVRRIAGLLQDINHGPNAGRHRVRVNGIRQKLDAVCRERFADSMATGLVAPLAAAAAPLDTIGQKRLETCARDLRTVETFGRKLGNATTYDALLLKASEAVQAAAGAGHLDTVRAVRLVEILSGPETAEAMYKQTVASAPRAR
jgi:hypothetical protein